jgi:hypothetical protein
LLEQLSYFIKVFQRAKLAEQQVGGRLHYE